jgi:hypothetical protein
MEKSLTYLEKIEIKQRIISNILINTSALNDCDKKIAEINSEEKRFFKTSSCDDTEKWENDFYKPLNDLEKEKIELQNIINNLKEEFIIIGVPVPQNKGYEIVNGLLEMKRDVNLKLIFYLTDDENEIRQVFLILIFNFINFFSYLL